MIYYTHQRYTDDCHHVKADVLSEYPGKKKEETN
jgi:hypothetical protein